MSAFFALIYREFVIARLAQMGSGAVANGEELDRVND